MPAVPLGLNAYKRANAFVPEVRCVNMYVEKDESGLSPDGILRIQRPGLTDQFTLAKNFQAMQRWPAKASTLYVSGGKVYLDQEEIGTASTGIASVAVTTLAAGIVAGGKFYLSDGETVALVDLPDNRVAVDVDQLNGYLLILTNTGRFYWLVPGETEIDPLDFATAESSGDAGRALRRLGDEFFIFGSDSTEVWQSTGDPDAPFARAPGRLYQRGCMSAATVRRFDNALVWVGDDGTVYRAGSVPQAISGPSLDERIRKRTGILSAWTFKIDGHEFYCLNIPGQGVFAYGTSTQAWCEFTWPVRFGETVDGTTLAATPTGRVLRLDAANATDAGEAFPRILSATVALMGRAARNDSISIGTGSSAPFTIRIRWRDGDEDYPEYYDEIDARAPMDVATMYRLGMPEQPQRTFELSVVEPVIVRIAGMVANQSWGGGNG